MERKVPDDTSHRGGKGDNFGEFCPEILQVDYAESVGRGYGGALALVDDTMPQLWLRAIRVGLGRYTLEGGRKSEELSEVPKL
jgi:hypothetical protein